MIAREFQLGDDFPPVDYAAWKKAAEADLKGVPFEKKLVSHPHEGIDLQPLYTEETAPTAGDPAGLPGFAPFIRGTRALGQTLRGWDVRQQHTHPEPAEVNRLIRDDLEHGATSIQLRFDAASSFGLDADDPRAADLCGREGVMLYNAGDVDRALAGVPLDEPVVFLDTGGAFLPAAVLVVAAAARCGIAPDRLRGAFNADPLGALMRDGRLTVPIETALAHLADLSAWTVRNAPGMRSVEVCTSPYHHAGATTTQDLAFLMATGLEYLRALTRAGLDVSIAARQFVFSDSLGCNFFRSIAKIRAARWLWSRIVAVCGGDADAQRMYLRVRTSRRVLTVRDPWVNVMRNTVCVFAGAIGGADAITTMPFDAALDGGSELGRHNARNAQIVLREEANLHRVVDAAGGSWFLETLTRQLAERAWSLLQEIERQGGMVQAALSGWVRRTIDAAQTAREKNIATGLEPITGVSEHPDIAEVKAQRRLLDRAALAAAAKTRLATWRKEHDARGAVRKLAETAAAPAGALGELTAAALRAAEAGATIGELAAALAAGTGEPARVAPLAVHPYDQAFEELRDACDAWVARRGTRPLVFLAGIGAVRDQIARMVYARNFFEAGGFATASRDGPADVDAALEAFARSGPRIAVICSTDQLYETIVEQLAPRLKAAGARTIVLAGHPGAHEARYRAAGVDRFIFVKCDVLDTLRALLREEGVLS
jgi:methylmalonyl-CoA mutase